jgi:perosamine synthetase
MTRRDAPQTPSVADTVPLATPVLRGNEWKYVKECLETNWVSSVGPFVERFEAAVAAYVGRRFAVATATGTAALHVALAAAGIGVDDEVLVSTLTFIAPANAVRYVGAWPRFVDAEPRYAQMDVGRVVEFLESRCRWQDGRLVDPDTGRRIRAVMPVHVLGHPVDLDPLLAVARKFDLAVIEDAAESLGARYRSRAVGADGDLACLSFNGNKVITSGGGGMVLTDDPARAERLRYLTTQAKDDPLEYVHYAVGFNYRLTNIQAAIGMAQMERLEAHLDAKRELAQRYAAMLGNVPGLSLPEEAPWAQSSSWLYTIQVEAGRFGRDSRGVIKALNAAGVAARPLWQPLHRSPAHAGSPTLGGEVAERLNRDAVSLPSSVDLTIESQQRVVEGVLGSRLKD